MFEEWEEEEREAKRKRETPMKVEEEEDATGVTRGPYSLPRIQQEDQNTKDKARLAAIK